MSSVVNRAVHESGARLQSWMLTSTSLHLHVDLAAATGQIFKKMDGHKVKTGSTLQACMIGLYLPSNGVALQVVRLERHGQGGGHRRLDQEDIVPVAHTH